MQLPGSELFTLIKANGDNLLPQEDVLAVEEPLQIQLQLHSATGSITKNVAVTMRTPGNDQELTTGFLFTEGIIGNNCQIERIMNSVSDSNNIIVVLKEDLRPPLHNINRNFYTTSSCGVCGKASLEAIRTVIPIMDAKQFTVEMQTIYSLQKKLAKEQALFACTGGLHAASLFSTEGVLIDMKEDVGRHNALDKLIGSAFLKGHLPLSKNILLLSGRASFELVQKAAMAGMQFIAAIGAPSSLAVELATEYNITLVGFLREDSMNIYCGAQRIK